nr:hypothetical protein [Tanacetum cinerariifolium]
MQTQTSNTLHNAIMEAGSKDRPPTLAPDNYVQWKSRIKRYIDTKPNHELIHYCLENPPYKDQLNAEAEAVEIILTGIDNDIYSTVDACSNVCEMWKAIERLKQDDETSKDKEIDKLMALISLLFKKIYKPTNNNLRTLSNTSRANQDNSPRINRNVRYENQRIGNVAGAREIVGSSVVVAASTPILAAKPAVVDVSTPISATKPAAKPAVVDVSTPISATKPAAKPKGEKIKVSIWEEC